MSRGVSANRKAFTIVELLVVIAIIGVLVGMLVPAAMSVYRRVRTGAMKLEIQVLANALEEYRNKYGEYPPDGSSWEIFERHIRKAFPQIEQGELDLLNPSSLIDNGHGVHVRNDSEPFPTIQDLRVMEPGEALVFFLGGFSEDVRHPFTGEGGPFKWINPADHTAGLQVNVSRLNAFFNFEMNRLTVAQVNVAGLNFPISVSTDETLWGMNYVNPNSPSSIVSGNAVNDLLPMYLALDTDMPYAYFDARTYARRKPSGYYFNRMVFFNQQTAWMNGAARPYKSDTQYDSAPPSGPTGTAEDHNFRYMNETTFQVIHPGADGMFGGDPGLGSLPVLYRFPSGRSDVGSSAYVGFKFWDDEVTNDSKASRQADNIANFSSGQLSEGSLQ